MPKEGRAEANAMVALAASSRSTSSVAFLGRQHLVRHRNFGVTRRWVAVSYLSLDGVAD